MTTTTTTTMTRTRRGAMAAPNAGTTECCTPPAMPDSVDVPDDDTLAAMAKAIAHPARLTILRLLAHRETCTTGDVVAELPLAQSTISEHLRILREAGLIQGEIEGPRTRYCVNANRLAALHAGVAAL